MERAIHIDRALCAGCGACAVACMDQNDIYPEREQPLLRRIHRVEDWRSPNAGIVYVSSACLHCEDSPCVVGCPTGAIGVDAATGAVVVDEALCIGCRSCSLACPFGVPRYDSRGKMRKCGLCSERVRAGLQPACVRVCPTGALKFDRTNRLLEEREHCFVGGIVTAARRSAAL